MAVFKILSVLLVAGSSPAWTSPQFPTSSPSTTPVPILRYVDNQNIDGSYTYGYEAADGTYKLETRYQDGRVKGKYGYVDPDGNLREASYGAEAGRGFEPQIEGLELPPPVITEAQQVEAVNEITQRPQFQNFRPQKLNSRVRDGQIKMINGRRALVKKVRKVKATPAPQKFIAESAQREASLRARQPESRSFNSFPQRSQESFRSQPAPAPERDPFVSGIDLSSGSYSYSY